MNCLFNERLFKKSGKNNTSNEDLRLSTDTSCVERRSHHILWKLVSLLFRCLEKGNHFSFVRCGFEEISSSVQASREVYRRSRLVTQICAALNLSILFILLFEHALICKF